MNKEIFESVKIELLVFEAEDIITTSPGSGSSAFNGDDDTIIWG